MLDYSREFVVLASHLNFTTAAKELHISQPGLSRHVAELEKEVGFTLVDRNPVKLTPAGKNYLHGIMPVIEALDDVLAESRSIAKSTKTRVTIRKPALEGYATQVALKAIAMAREAGFLAEFVLEDDRALTAFEAIELGKADVGFVYDYFEDGDVPEGVKCELLSEEPFHMWVHRDNPLAVKDPLYFADFKDLNLVCSVGRRFEDWNSGVRNVYRRYGMEPKYRVKDLNDLSGFLREMQTDETLMTSPVMASFTSLSPFIVDRVPQDDVAPTCPTSVAYRTDGGEELMRFVRFCKQAAEDLSKV